MEKSRFEKTNPKILIAIIKELRDRLKIKKPTFDWGFENTCNIVLDLFGIERIDWIDLNYIHTCYMLNVDNIDSEPFDFIRPISKEYEFETKVEAEEIVQLTYENKISSYGDLSSTSNFINYLQESSEIDILTQNFVKRIMMDRYHRDMSVLKNSLKEI